MHFPESAWWSDKKTAGREEVGMERAGLQTSCVTLLLSVLLPLLLLVLLLALADKVDPQRSHGSMGIFFANKKAFNVLYQGTEAPLLSDDTTTGHGKSR